MLDLGARRATRPLVMTSRTLLIRIASLTVALAALLTGAPALAKQEYYDVISSGTGTCADCRLCHTGPVGNGETFDSTKPFAVYMYGTGRVGMLPDPAQNSDGDGATDLAELEQFGDPNDAMIGPGEFVCPTGPAAEFGCLRVSAHAPGSTWQCLGLAIAGLLFLRRQR